MKEKKEKKEKHKKDKFVDDNRTIIEMNVDGMPWYDGNGPHDKKTDKKDNDKPTKRELIKMIFGLYKAMLPFLLLALACFTAVFVLLFLALKSTL